jgi:hypothetical protein
MPGRWPATALGQAARRPLKRTTGTWLKPGFLHREPTRPLEPRPVPGTRRVPGSHVPDRWPAAGSRLWQAAARANDCNLAKARFLARSSRRVRSSHVRCQAPDVSLGATGGSVAGHRLSLLWQAAAQANDWNLAKARFLAPASRRVRSSHVRCQAPDVSTGATCRAWQAAARANDWNLAEARFLARSIRGIRSRHMPVRQSPPPLETSVPGHPTQVRGPRCPRGRRRPRGGPRRRGAGSRPR